MQHNVSYRTSCFFSRRSILTRVRRAALWIGLVLLAGCTASRPAPRPATEPEQAEAAWKERLPVRYAFVEHRGDYRTLVHSMRRLFALMQEADVPAAGPPFALFFDDPGSVPVDELRARACVPIEPALEEIPAGLQKDWLEGGLVVYARVRGRYPDVPKAYPGLFEFARKLGWSVGGPVREVYLADPETAGRGDELLTEVQIARRFEG